MGRVKVGVGVRALLRSPLFFTGRFANVKGKSDFTASGYFSRSFVSAVFFSDHFGVGVCILMAGCRKKKKKQWVF